MRLAVRSALVPMSGTSAESAGRPRAHLCDARAFRRGLDPQPKSHSPSGQHGGRLPGNGLPGWLRASS
eukprot:3799131-Prymnesium_polylepis.1